MWRRDAVLLFQDDDGNGGVVQPPEPPVQYGPEPQARAD